MDPAKRALPYLKLYWVTTDDHAEDWFWVARTKRDAERYHSQAEGYDDPDAAEAELVCRIPDELIHPNPDDLLGWPTAELIEGCGGIRAINPSKGPEYIRGAALLGCGRRAFKFGDRLYVEGDAYEYAADMIGTDLADEG
jgi:hypothetical protein